MRSGVWRDNPRCGRSLLSCLTHSLGIRSGWRSPTTRSGLRTPAARSSRSVRHRRLPWVSVSACGQRVHPHSGTPHRTAPSTSRRGHDRELGSGQAIFDCEIAGLLGNVGRTGMGGNACQVRPASCPSVPPASNRPFLTEATQDPLAGVFQSARRHRCDRASPCSSRVYHSRDRSEQREEGQQQVAP